MGNASNPLNMEELAALSPGAKAAGVPAKKGGGSNLLSQAEIEALSGGIKAGGIPVDTGYNTAARVRKHDLANEDSSLGVNVSALDMINERFIRLFRLALLEVLRTSPRINPSRVQLLKFGDYMKDLRPPLSVNVVRMSPLRGTAMVLIDPNVIFSSLENFFGGVGSGVGPQLAPGRLFTPTESRVIGIILDVLFKSLKEAWSPLLAIDFEIISSEINPMFAQIADENDLVIVNRFDAEFGDSKGFLHVVYPYSALKPIRDQLKSRVASPDADQESEEPWKIELTSAVGDVKLEMRVVIGSITSTLSQLDSLKVGDLLYFKKTEHARGYISDIPVFDARIGTSGPNVAIKVDRLLEASK
jgi:flagellar motor switch protein FliM